MGRLLLLAAGIQLACALNFVKPEPFEESELPVINRTTVPRPKRCLDPELLIKKPLEEKANVNYTGLWRLVSFTGDIQETYKAMGVPYLIRQIPLAFNYGIGHMMETVVHNGLYLKIHSETRMGLLPPVIAEETTYIGYTTFNKAHGYYMCPQWGDNRSYVALDTWYADTAQPKEGPRYSAPRTYRFQKGDHSYLLAELDGYRTTMVYERVNWQPFRRPTGHPGYPYKPAYAAPGSVATGAESEANLLDDESEHPKNLDELRASTPSPDQAAAYAEMMSLGLLPPFMPMQLNRGWNEVLNDMEKQGGSPLMALMMEAKAAASPGSCQTTT